jgi:DNA adenine methylase
MHTIPQIIKDYPGSKGQAGVYQTIINQIPPHDYYFELFAGSGQIYRYKLPAYKSSTIMDIDPAVIEKWKALPLANTIVFNGDAIEKIKLMAGANVLANNRRTFIYLDPCYPKESRRNPRNLYKHEMEVMDHEILLKNCLALDCNIAISTYKNDLYSDRLKDWRFITFETTTHAGPATEYLYMNYPEPDALHDYRYLGADYRERERIKLKTSRTIRKIGALPELERRALLSAINQVYH